MLGSQRRVGFVVPPSILAGTYFVALAGETADGASYASLSGSCSEVAVTHVDTSQSGCVASGTLSVNAPPKGGTITAYAANGCWECLGAQYKGVQAVNLEGPILSTSISTPDVVNSCGTNSVTGQTVCAANGSDVYLLQDTSLITTLQSGSSGKSTLHGAPNNFGVAINPVTNQAVLGVGLDRNKAGASTGLQVLNLGTNTFASPVPAKNEVSDEILIDPGRGFVLSPNNGGNYDIFSLRADGSAYEFSNQLSAFEEWDSAAEDCSTGIVLAPTGNFSGDIYIGDVTQAQFDQNKKTWTAPEQVFPLGVSLETIAIAPGNSHLGILSHEYTNGGEFAVIQLPASSGAGTPTILDYVRTNIPGFLGTPDPHSITAYTSPNDGKAYGVLASSFPAVDLARIDLACVLAQPRNADAHSVSGYASSCIKVFATGNAAPAPPTITAAPRASTEASYVYEDQIRVTAANRFPLSFSLLSGPAGLSIDPVTGVLHWVPSAAQVGDHSFTVRVADVFDLTATASFPINVYANRNTPPVITSTPVTRSIVGAYYSYQVTATDKSPTSLRFSLSAAPTGMTIDPVSGLVQWTPSTGLANQTASVTLQVIDAIYLYASQSFQIVLLPAANHPPVIISNPVATATVGQVYSYQVRAKDPDNDPLAYSLVSAPLGTTLDAASGLLQWTPVSTDTGDLSISVRAQDPGALVATQTFALHVQRAYPVPTIAISSPTPGLLLNKPTDIIATISDPTTSGPPISWTVDLLRGDNSTQRIGSGSGAVSGNAIAHLDPTLIRDDSYSVVITVGKNGQEDSKSFAYNISSNNLKLGNFTTSFTDISIPVAGIPLTITRVYNSLDTSTGEFGAGWRLGLPGQVVDSARETPLEPFTASTRVYVTRPDGTREGFTFAPTQPSPLIPIFVPGFKPDAGVTDTLSVVSADIANSGGAYYQFLGGPYNPSTYKLTTKYGVEYTIDEVAGLEQIKDRNGNTLTVTPEGIQSSSGLSLPIEHDSRGRITRITEPGGGYVHYSYSDAGNLTSSFDQLGNETTYSYDNATFPHYLTTITDPLGRPVTRSVYDGAGRLTARCGVNGDVSSLRGCVQISDDPALATQTVTSGRGFRTDLSYDNSGNISLERHWLTADHYLDTNRTFDTSGNMLTEIDPNGNTSRSTFDGSGNLLTHTDSGGHSTSYTYNACNAVTSDTDIDGRTSRYTYDERCNVTGWTDVAGHTTTFAYDQTGDPVMLLDPTRSSWKWTYDSRGLPTTFTDPFGKQALFTYNQAGDLVSQVDRAGHRFDYSYNPAHQLLKETWGDGHQTTYTYDSAGVITSVKDPDSSLLFTSDAAGRLLAIDNAGTNFAPAVRLTYTYDSDGNVASVADSLGGITREVYDPLDRLTSLTQSGTGVQPKRVDLHYDDSGLTTRINRFSDLNGLQSVSTTTFTFACGNCPGLVSGIHHRLPDGSPIEDLDFTRDATGHIASLQDADGLHSYRLDPANMLLSATHHGSGQEDESYTYDPLGDRLSSNLSSKYLYSWQTSGSGHRLMNDDQFSYVYDDEGNLSEQTDRKTGELTNFGYDYSNRLVKVARTSGSGDPLMTSSYTYDFAGRRIRAVENGTELRYIYDGANPILRFDSTNQLFSRRFYNEGPDLVLADEVAGQTHWFHSDNVGTIRDVSANDGTRLAHYSYDPFGRLLSPTNSALKNDLTFTAREYSPSTGLLFLRDRYYNPGIGRFLSEDPLGFAGGDLNLYSYVKNSPLDASDPTGDELFERAEIEQRVAAFEQNAADCLGQQLIADAAQGGVYLLVAAAGGTIYPGEAYNVYAGQTVRNFSLRFAEHLRAGKVFQYTFRFGIPESAIAKNPKIVNTIERMLMKAFNGKGSLANIRNAPQGAGCF